MKKEFLSFPRDAKLYLYVQFLASGYYTWPFWYGFASGIISASQFGIYLATGHVVSLLAEVPTGAFADRFGRKRSAMIGLLCAAALPLIVYVGGSFGAYLLGAIVAGIGGAFVSGSLDSHLYELPDMTPVLYRRVMMYDTFFWQSGLIFSSAVGGFLYLASPLVPFVGEAASFVCAFFLVSKMANVQQEDKGSTTVQELGYIGELKEGFVHLFRVRELWSLLVFGTMVGVLMWMGIEYVNEAAMIHYGIAPNIRGLLIAGSKLLMLVGLNLFVLNRLKTDRNKLVYLLVLTLAIFGLYSTGGKALFLAGFLLFNFVSSTQANFVRPIIHDHVQSKWRATALSSYSFIGSGFQAIAAIAVGLSLQTRGVVFAQRMLLLCFVIIGVPAFVRYLPRTESKQQDAA